jgi:hypothetical protein
LYSVSIPTEKFQSWNIIKINPYDRMTSEEFYPIIDDSLTFMDYKTTLQGVYIVGISIQDKYMYAMTN